VVEPRVTTDIADLRGLWAESFNNPHNRGYLAKILQGGTDLAGITSNLCEKKGND